jgi:hypothetical protein
LNCRLRPSPKVSALPLGGVNRGPRQAVRHHNGRA